MPTPMSNLEMAVRRSELLPSGPDGWNKRWQDARERFLAAVDPRQRPVVEAVLSQPFYGGAGLRAWLAALANRGGVLPPSLPQELVVVYLEDSEALPLHDCADCGLAIPVRPGRSSFVGEVERVYFRTCPCCGGRTGWYAHLGNSNRKAKARPSGVP